MGFDTHTDDRRRRDGETGEGLLIKKMNKMGLQLVRRISNPRLTLDQAEFMVQKQVKALLNENQYSALVLHAMDIGGYSFARSALLKRLNAGDYLGASACFKKRVIKNTKRKKSITTLGEAKQRLFLLPVLIINRESSSESPKT